MQSTNTSSKYTQIWADDVELILIHPEVVIFDVTNKFTCASLEQACREAFGFLIANSMRHLILHMCHV